MLKGFFVPILCHIEPFKVWALRRFVISSDSRNICAVGLLVVKLFGLAACFYFLIASQNAEKAFQKGFLAAIPKANTYKA
ncbi:MAG: hypothetical protein ABI388_02945 [Bacteroidia bacterium]